ncbi:MAG TPA: DUF1501 domain-containing protein [Planctomycetaceae bacterium]|jgi:hypothetical protein|nr:DUF1501 domain-containing protein [Planctomycetaceae bacterium]
MKSHESLLEEARLARVRLLTRRHFLRQSQIGLGALALSSLIGAPRPARGAVSGAVDNALAARLPVAKAKARAVIYLHMSGSPPQQDLFDYKPKLVEYNMQPCPDELLKGQRFPFIKGHPNLLGTPYHFRPHGDCGTVMSELLPHIGGQIDDIALIRSMWTDQFNHAPAELLLHTGSPRFGSASMGSWVTYGLGSENQDLPGFVVLVSGDSDPSAGKSVWGSGFLPSVFQGVQCRTSGDPILYVSDPPGMSRDVRRRSLDALGKLNRLELAEFGDPETLTRISQYELAYRMQISVPDVMDISREPAHMHEAYGTRPGVTAFANNCLLARRLVERGVRYVQLFDWGWDMHGTARDNDLITGLPKKCHEVDRPIAALLGDLKSSGLLDETLVIWSGEFGRTSMNEARGGSKLLGRDHHPHCFSMWLAGGGIKGGTALGETDDLGYFITKDKVTVHDLQATVLSLLGVDAHHLTFPFQGLDQRLIGPTNDAKIIRQILS